MQKVVEKRTTGIEGCMPFFSPLKLFLKVIHKMFLNFIIQKIYEAI